MNCTPRLRRHQLHLSHCPRSKLPRPVSPGLHLALDSTCCASCSPVSSQGAASSPLSVAVAGHTPALPESPLLGPRCSEGVSRTLTIVGRTLHDLTCSPLSPPLLLDFLPQACQAPGDVLRTGWNWLILQVVACVLCWVLLW